MSDTDPPEPTPGGDAPPSKRKKTLRDSDEMEAQAHLLEARAALIKAKWSFADRLIMRGLIPLSLLVAGPMATYYFHVRAEKSDETQKRMEALIASNEALGKRLEQILVVAAAKREVASFGRDELTREIASCGRSAPDFDEIRVRVEKKIHERVSAQVGDGPHVNAAVRGAVDEVAPDFEKLVRDRGGSFSAPPKPRFMEQAQKK